LALRLATGILGQANEAAGSNDPRRLDLIAAGLRRDEAPAF
jgi:hypothetical protein